MRAALDNLSQSMRALAQPAPVQARLFPSFVVVPDELALDFDDAYQLATEQHRGTWSREQAAALAALDRKLSAMSDAKDEALWLGNDALLRPEWSEVRALASAVLAAFSWPTGAPPSSAATYVGPPRLAKPSPMLSLLRRILFWASLPFGLCWMLGALVVSPLERYKHANVLVWLLYPLLVGAVAAAPALGCLWLVRRLWH